MITKMATFASVHVYILSYLMKLQTDKNLNNLFKFLYFLHAVQMLNFVPSIIKNLTN